jgi:hypothetical protein
MKRATWLVVSFCALCACAQGPEDELTATAVRDVGLKTDSAAASVPPSGDGVAPVVGFPGDGAATVTQVGGWSGGPGAIKWHGGQWVIPYDAHPGSVITNMWCDVVPNATSTDLIELIGSAGVIGSVTVPALTGIVIRAWIIPSPGYTVPDGGPIVVRHSPRNTATGQWTGVADDLTIISCAVRSVRQSTRVVRFRPQWLNQGPFVIADNPCTRAVCPPVWRASGPSPALASFEIPYQAGDTITALGWDAFGSGTTQNDGLGTVSVFYQQTMGGIGTVLADTFDINRPQSWGSYNVTPFFPVTLQTSGMLWVSMEVDAIGYYIGDVVATFTTPAY